MFLAIVRSVDRMPAEFRELACYLRDEIESLVTDDPKVPLIALGGRV